MESEKLRIVFSLSLSFTFFLFLSQWEIKKKKKTMMMKIERFVKKKFPIPFQLWENLETLIRGRMISFPPLFTLLGCV